MVSSPQHEPTMEEILASIRKIISEDSPEAQPESAPELPTPAPAPAPVAAAPVPAPVAIAEADVLELTQEVEEAPPMPAIEPIRQAPPVPENDVVFEPRDQETPVVPETPAPSHSPEGIFSDKTRRALDDAFASIEPEAEEQHAAASASAPSVEGLSVEAVFERAVRESFAPVVNQWLGGNADAIVERMKPLVREWMDEHFPALLEGAVRDEVARVARARGAKR